MVSGLSVVDLCGGLRSPHGEEETSGLVDSRESGSRDFANDGFEGFNQPPNHGRGLGVCTGGRILLVVAEDDVRLQAWV